MTDTFGFIKRHIRVIRAIILVLAMVYALSWSFSELFGKEIDAAAVPEFGITYHLELRFDERTKTYQQEEVLKDLQTIQQLGVDVIRTDVSWQRVPLNDADALQFDRWFLSQVHGMGMEVMFILKTREQITLYAPLLSEMDYIQIANEPNSIEFSTALGSTDPSVIIQKASSNHHYLKSLAPAAATLFNPADLPRIPEFITISWADFYKGLANNGVSPSIIGVDSYPGGPYEWGYPLEIVRTVRIAKEYLDAELSQKPVWILETGSPTYQRSRASQTDYLRNAVQAVESAGAGGLIIYEAFDNPDVVSEVTEYAPESALIEAQFGIFDENRHPKPAALTYQQLISDAHNQEPVQGISLSQILYVMLSALYRLVEPPAGPMALTELLILPNFLFIAVGLLFRWGLGTGLTKAPIRWPFSGMVFALGILSFFLLFQRLFGLQTMLRELFLFYSGLFLLFLWSGVAQIIFLSKSSISKLSDYLPLFIPPALGIIVSLLMEKTVVLWFMIAFIESLLLALCVMLRVRRHAGNGK